MTRNVLARMGDLLADRSNRFTRREDGTVTIFGVMMFILMVIVGGIAVDIMRYETQRVQLQETLDRAVLAAAALNQTIPAEDVVADYFSRSGLERYRLRLDVDDGVNFRTVSATAEMDINTMFMDFFGIRALTSPAYGRAEERVQNVEISMVLDVSGSMGWNSASGGTKIEALRTAAAQFVSTVLEPNDPVNDEMLVSISIVPYNGFVNAGSTAASVFNIGNQHSQSICTHFSEAQMDRTDLGATETIARLGHFDYSYRYWRVADFEWYGIYREAESAWRHYCPTDDRNAITLWSQNEADLLAEVNGLSAGGWTAIDQGMRWGVALLDPSSQDELEAYFQQGEVSGTLTVHEDFRGRPDDYTVPGEEEETVKIVVLMTDGENTEQWDINPLYASGPSPIWYNDSTNLWSIHIEDQGRYYLPPSLGETATYNNYGGTFSSSPRSGSRQLSWPEMWERFTMRTISEDFFRTAADESGSAWAWTMRNDIRDNGLQQFAGPWPYNTANQNLRDICDAANAQGIRIFTIAFEAPARGQDVMDYCATTDADYFPVEGLEISEAFASISATINSLRLTQ